MKKKEEEKQLLVFGYGLPLIFLFLAWRKYVKHGLTGWVEGLIIAAALVLVMAIYIPSWLKALFKYWMGLAGIISVIVTTLILSVFFFGVMTPISLILKLLGKDFMHLRYKDGRDSYWIKREIKKEDYTQQF